MDLKNKKHLHPHSGKHAARFRKSIPEAATFAEQILKGNKHFLSRALTLAESKLPEHRHLINDIIRRLLPHTGQSLRIGVTGVPGAGKSTFIDRLGEQYIAQGHQVAVLAVDPSSAIHQGSILGDKTRMNRLSQAQEAYIRPVPGGEAIGGIARYTMESILLFEAAGYDRIIVETIGSGQSEISVWYLTDLMILLKIPGAGDDLQGIKRGIMELADLILINKADGPWKKEAEQAVRYFQQALTLSGRPTGSVPVWTISALEGQGVEKVRRWLENTYLQRQKDGSWARKRTEQNLYWFDRQIHYLFDHIRRQNQNLKEYYRTLRQQLEENKITPHEAAEAYWKHFIKSVSG